MLSNIFSSFGEMVAPRPEPLSELISLIRSGQSELACKFIKSHEDHINWDSREPRLGMCPLHMACAVGDITVVVELLSRGADLDIKSSAEESLGNRALHFAAMNDRKLVVEVLLRSGADPSLPNENGQIPYELADSAEVRQVLLVDKTEIAQKILSPMALARHSQRKLSVNFAPVDQKGPEADADSSPAPESSPSSIGGDDRRTNPGNDDAFSYLADDENEAELHSMVLQAAKETSAAYLDQDLSLEDRLFLFKACQVPPKDEKQLKKTRDRMVYMLARRPDLVQARLIELGNFGNEGQTPVHVAASNNNLEMLQLFLETDPNCSWLRDLQGRTPLHCATENVHTDNYEVCKVLREVMCTACPERDPVGDNAPLDLAGRTPLGRQNRQKKGTSPKPPAKIQALLFEPGDRSVLPLSPVHRRTGSSPSKSPDFNFSGASVTQENLVYAFSEASGWKPYMEDRVLIQCPLAQEISWSLFAVFDGHGGSFCSQYLSENLPRILSTATKAQVDLNEPTASVELKSVSGEKVSENGQPKSAKCLDGSGSTMVLCVVTNDFYAIANVGDSRAVVGQHVLGDDAVRCTWSSTDHKISLEEERSRVEEAGIGIQNTSLILGGVTQNVSRSFGDFVFKQNKKFAADRQAVIANPDVTIFDRNESDKFVVLACDGVFDVMSNAEVVTFVSSRIRHTGEDDIEAVSACDELLQECLSRGSCDNMTVLLVIFEGSTVVSAQTSPDEKGSDVSKRLF
eukprot:GSChrysophyteH1.ASY1.ANO1.1385.1 assembled CDS